VPQEFNIAQKKNMVVMVVDYQLITGNLYKMGADRILRICVLEHQRSRILAKAHEGIVGGHYAGKATASDYGGQPFRETRRTTAINSMYIRGLVNQI
jgi:hypothetical protein